MHVITGSSSWTTYEAKPCRVMFITGVAAAGLNLFRASVLVMVEPTWSDEGDRQIHGRVCRKGQQREVEIIRVLVKDSVDDWMCGLATDKSKHAQLVFSNNHAGPSTTTRSIPWYDLDGDIPSGSSAQRNAVQREKKAKEARVNAHKKVLDTRIAKRSAESEGGRAKRARTSTDEGSGEGLDREG